MMWYLSPQRKIFRIRQLKGKSVGTAKLKHTYYIYYYNQKYSYDEEFTINVTKFEDTYSGSAYIYFLKLPTGDPMNNDTGSGHRKPIKVSWKQKSVRQVLLGRMATLMITVQFRTRTL